MKEMAAWSYGSQPGAPAAPPSDLVAVPDQNIVSARTLYSMTDDVYEATWSVPAASL